MAGGFSSKYLSRLLQSYPDELIATLSPLERAALALGQLTNENPFIKRAGMRFIRHVGAAWAYPSIAPRVYAEGFDWMVEAEPDRGVVVVANHRTFFDLFTVMLCLFKIGVRWIERAYFPVRANFFYENPAGMALNYFISGGAMYPPLYRQSSRSALNQDALDRLCRMLARSGTLVGLHPEGTRNKGADPYELLPAQPGVGQIVLHARPIVVPVFVHGLSNNLADIVLTSYRRHARRDHPVILVGGDPLDYSEFTRKKPRLALYKRCADRMNDAIRERGAREREIRAACARGEVSPDDANWLGNRIARRSRSMR